MAATGLPHANPKYYNDTPIGYSWFPKEIASVPRAWVAAQGNLVWYRQHTSVSSIPIIPHTAFQTEMRAWPAGINERGGLKLTANPFLQGGHFAAMEKPAEIMADIEDFVKQVWPVKK